ncbi:uncharacterized protein F5147DRAFT_773823 [Suillus discolor]|uniref:Uncharacterized protein n=1 Tax=Suillus discolor TaxID=1912936 RepID=A0A9P7F5Y4_9AGAM|nr:uncharacterized protein F5147DRAFT_773823 [Suillus discolor]KAG2108242.1 hypothetical protein F5147DRAFT_773823 [Suillus discolor]
MAIFDERLVSSPALTHKFVIDNIRNISSDCSGIRYMKDDQLGAVTYPHNPSMNLLCYFQEWSSNDAKQFLKTKWTIQDVDGQCSLKVTGSRKGCPIAAHYHLPLYALNKKFGIYKKVVEHLWDSSGGEATTVRNTYLSVIKYLHEVRIAFLDNAGGSPNLLHGDFRSPALDYYLWMDHMGDGFDDDDRQALHTAHGVTFEALKNGQCSDILVFLDWRTYHKTKCRKHDFCAALQGCGGSEDLEHLLSAIDASINAVEHPAVSTTSIDILVSACSSAHITLVLDDPDVDSQQLNPFPKFPLPFDINCRSMALSTLGGYAHQILVGGFGRWLPSHIAMHFREIQAIDYNELLENLVANGLLVTAQNTEEFLEIFAMAEMMVICQQLSVDRGSMARFFTAAGRALYAS